MKGEILIRLPINGTVMVSASGKGESKVKAVEMYEKIRPRFQKVFQCWYEMQLVENIVNPFKEK